MSSSLPACCTAPSDASFAEQAYAAYNAAGDPATAGVNYQGKPCPIWSELPENVRAKWKGVEALVARLGRPDCASELPVAVQPNEDPVDPSWVPFYYESDQVVGALASVADWERLLVRAEQDGRKLDRPTRIDGMLASPLSCCGYPSTLVNGRDLPSFGTRLKQVSSALTLRAWAEQNGMIDKLV